MAYDAPSAIGGLRNASDCREHMRHIFNRKKDIPTVFGNMTDQGMRLVALEMSERNHHVFI